MSKAYIKGTIKKLFELSDGVSTKTGKPWTRLDMVITKEDGEEQILKVWSGDTLQAYEGATVEAHGKLDEYKGEVRVVADAKDVTVNGASAPTPEQAKTVLSGGPSVSKGQRTLSEYVDFVAEYHPKFKKLVDSDEAAKSYVITAWIDIGKGGMTDDLAEEEPVPF